MATKEVIKRCKLRSVAQERWLGMEASSFGKEHEELRTKGIPLPAGRSPSAAGRNQGQWLHLVPLTSVTTSFRDTMVSYTPGFALSDPCAKMET